MKIPRPELPATVALVATLLTSTASFSASTTHHYTVTVDDSLRRLSVKAQFTYPVERVSARSSRAGRFLESADGCEDGARIKVRNRRISFSGNGVRCLNYSVDLQEAAEEYRGAAYLSDHNIVASPSYWMWRPALSGDTTIDVDFILPDGVQVSVPWSKRDNSNTAYSIGASPESAKAPAVFGQFDYREIDVPGATLRVTQLAGKSDMDNEAIANWIRATATDVSLTYGRFPNPSPQVVVMPVRSTRSPVAFGRVVRDGGETVELLVDPEGDIEDFYSDWTATHEFSHMLLPYLDSRFHWISEGFSQYYQNILLTRSGAYDAERMWQNLYNGFERGRKSSPDLSPNEATGRGIRGSRMKVYWSGAALALMADVALRERSDGEETLDDVLERLQSCCLPSSETWSGAEFFAKLDTLIDEPLFTPLYSRYADTAGFPDTGDLYSRLGLSVADGDVTIEQEGELKAIRDTMSETNSAVAKWRAQLAAD